MKNYDFYTREKTEEKSLLSSSFIPHTYSTANLTLKLGSYLSSLHVTRCSTRNHPLLG